MTKLLTGKPRNSSETGFDRSRQPVADALDKATVAELSPLQISRMTCEELVRAIRAAELPLMRTDAECHLQHYDRDTLVRLVYLARRCCRNQGY